jgi:hypothetical protein
MELEEVGKYFSSKLQDEDIGPFTRLVFNPATGTHEEMVPMMKFIKGPIPFEWLRQANALPGKAGAVGVALWFLKGVRRSSEFVLTAEAQSLAGCSRQALYRALHALQVAGLITITERRGGRPRISILGGLILASAKEVGAGEATPS